MMPSMDATKVEESPFYESFMKMYAGFTDAVKNYGGFESYAEKIEKWDKNKLMTQYMDVAEPMKCGFVVMNHGDPWLNNMMFKADADNKSIDCKLIDFQMPFWASPAADLLYFLVSSVENDIKVEHFDDFIEFYHTELSSGLKKLGYDQYIPTLAELHVDLLEKGFFGEFKNFTCFKGQD
jgi:thiamine kinase-like enzyme